jgi:diguanylate cyclase (GGDEF)-like protein/PAS domain S-box-containing protein
MTTTKGDSQQADAAVHAPGDFTQLANFLDDIVARFDTQHRHTYVNSAVEHFTGLGPQEFVGKTNAELGMPPELVKQWDGILDGVFETGQPHEERFSFAGPHGVRQFVTRALPEKDPQGHVTAVMTVARDVTPQLPQPEPADMAAQHCQAIVDSSDDAIIGKTLTGIVTSWNRGAQAVFGYSATEMLGQSLLILFPPERMDEEAFFIERLLLGEKIDHFETVRIHKDGRRVHVSVTISPIRDAHGRIVGASKIARDITPIKMERERLQLALDATCNGLWDWNLVTGTVYRSAQYYAVVGHAPEHDAHDFAFFQRIVHPQDWAHVQAHIDAYRQGQSDRLEYEFRLVTDQGVTERWMMVRGQAVERNAQGLPLRMVGTLSDITHSKHIDARLRDREKCLSRVIEGSDQGYWDWNVQTEVLHVSTKWETMLGYQPGELDFAQRHFSNYVHPDDLAMVMDKVQQHLQGQLPHMEAEIRCLTQTGTWCWILTRGRVVEWDHMGQPLMMSGTHTDITERKSLELSQRAAATVFDNSYEGIVVISPAYLIVKANPAFTRITGYTLAEVMGQSPHMVLADRNNPDLYHELWRSVTFKGFWTGEIWSTRKSGDIYAQLVSISPVVDVRGEVQHYIVIFSDISVLKAHEAELDRVAHYDPLTGVPNRRLLVDRLAQAITRTSRTHTSLAVCYLDLDGFKAVNDHYGHAMGDRLLVGVTENLKQVLRAQDTLARLGGDEFVVLLCEVGDAEECPIILERILHAIATPLYLDGHTISVSASIGVSIYPQDLCDADTLLRHADQAMYRAKDEGKNRYHLFDPDSDRKAKHHRQFLDHMDSALKNDEFCLHYQPQIDLLTGKVVGVEALIRWRHPQRGLLSPAEFLPHVENSCLEYPLGLRVIHMALGQVMRWHAQGVAVKVCVNVSANHLLQPQFVADLQAALYQHGAQDLHCLELEVLESAAIGDIDKATHILHQCHHMGVQLALDDFGTGYSSLTYLRKLPVDMLKIDRSFVMDMLQDPEDRGLVEGVIRLAKAFNCRVIAEGVETLQHGAALLQLGCHLAQGFGISKPMPADQFVAWQAQWQLQQLWLALAEPVSE